MNQIISISIGQAGINLSDTCTQQFCMEHNIDVDGNLTQNSKDDPEPIVIFEEQQGRQNYYKSRSIFIDSASTSIDQIRTGNNHQIYHPQNFVSGNGECNGNYAQGYHSYGNEMIDEICDIIRKNVEKCEKTAGFMIYHGISGGTGSGLTSLIQERLSIDYKNKPKLNYQIFPNSQNLSSFTEPYNTLLSCHSLMKHDDPKIIFDNEAISRKFTDLQIKNYTVDHINQLIAQYISTCTAAIRFDSQTNVQFNEIKSKLVPFERWSFLIPGMTGLFQKVEQHDDKDVLAQVRILSQDSIHKQNCLANCEVNEGKFISSCLFFRGDVPSKYVGQGCVAMRLSKNFKFANWDYYCINWAHCYKELVQFKQSPFYIHKRVVYSLNNSTAISETFDQIYKQTSKMFMKRSFIHSYTDYGIEQDEFQDALEYLGGLVLDYQQTEYEDLQEEGEQGEEV